MNKIDPTGQFTLSDISIGFQLYAIQIARIASPSLYLLNRISQNISNVQLQNAIQSFTSGVWRLSGNTQPLRLVAGNVFEKFLRPAMSLLKDSKYHGEIVYGSIPDWIVSQRYIVDAKLGQSINWGQFANFVRWAAERGGNVTYITLTVPPQEMVSKAKLLAEGAGTAVKFIPLLRF